jgi:hypothetical protein
MPKYAQAAKQSETAADGELLKRVRCEFLEMPGLQLTSKQAARLWDVDHDIACRLLDTLMGLRFLTKTKAGAYARSVG